MIYQFLICNTMKLSYSMLPYHIIVRGPNPWFWVNLVLPDKVFFSTVSCSLGIALKDSGGCQVISLEHFQILTLFQNGHRQTRGKSNFWTRPPRNLCNTSFKSNLTTRIKILTLFLCHDLILTPKVKMSAFRLTKNSAEIGENLTFEPDYLETCVIPLLRVIWLQWFQFWYYFCVMTSFWPYKVKMATIRLTKYSAEIGENNFWTRPPRNLCDISFKSNLTTRIPVLTLFLCHSTSFWPQKLKMAAIGLTKNPRFFRSKIFLMVISRGPSMRKEGWTWFCQINVFFSAVSCSSLRFRGAPSHIPWAFVYINPFPSGTDLNMKPQNCLIFPWKTSSDQMHSHVYCL